MLYSAIGVTGPRLRRNVHENTQKHILLRTFPCYSGIVTAACGRVSVVRFPFPGMDTRPDTGLWLVGPLFCGPVRMHGYSVARRDSADHDGALQRLHS